jgi:hypothetical protein
MDAKTGNKDPAFAWINMHQAYSNKDPVFCMDKHASGIQLTLST